MTKKKYAQRFKLEWLKDKRFEKWLEKVEGNDYRCFCKYCKCSITAKVFDIMKHSETSKHKRAANPQSAQRLCHPSDEDWSMQGVGLKNDNGEDFSFIHRSKTRSHQPPFVPVHQDGAASPAPSGKEVIIPASIGFIGAGNMAQALMNSFLAKGLVEAHLLMASAPSNRNLEKLPSGMRTTNDNNRLVKECDIIFLCVKPHLLTEMIEGLDPLERDHSPLFISVVTGFDICTLEQLLGSLIDAPRVVRTMPNTPCMVGQGCCVYTMGTNTNESDAKVVYSVLHSVGFCAEVPEYQMDAACGLAGSGPAYIYAAIEALADGGVKMGLPRHLSQHLAAHTVKGAASMVLQTGKHPGQLKDEVCSPGGTTITAMHSLEKNGFRNALMSAVEASANRSKELGNKS
ncbi:uncharacterized protein P5cr isoform X2 [Macrobrachium rosenbergii]|uniref:uncharacterized protein P5cr isoform X2 n=1 Tax=Macrobrachium rosenbergii TaxID=79674 RepID=UPI0034D5A7FE